ncbi:unnamed protein product [Heterobilharzia americana]|nr:unnamed protein product [Heterobilharzia americana]
MIRKTGYISQEQSNRNQSQTIHLTISDMTSSCEDLHNSRIRSKLTECYEKSTFLQNSTSSSSSSPSLSFNRPKSSSPSHEDSTQLILHNLMNSDENITQQTYNMKNRLHESAISLNDSKESNNNNVSDTDGDHNDIGTDVVNDTRVEQHNCYNQMTIREQLYSHLPVYKQTNSQCPTDNSYENRGYNTYLNDLSTEESTDMKQLVKKSRYCPSTYLNCVDSLTDKPRISDTELNELKSQCIHNTMISSMSTSTSVSSSISVCLSKPSFHPTEFKISQAIPLNDGGIHSKKPEQDLPMNVSNVDMHLNNAEYKFNGFQPRLEYPHQCHMNYQNNSNNNNGDITIADHSQFQYHLNGLYHHRHHHHHPHHQEKDYTMCSSLSSSSSPLQNYFPSFPFEHLSRYSAYANMNLKDSDHFSVNNEHHGGAGGGDGGGGGGVGRGGRVLHHSMLNGDDVVEHLHKSIMNTTSSSNGSNSSNDNYSCPKPLIFDECLANIHKQSPYMNNNASIVTTIASATIGGRGEHLPDSRHMEPPFPSSILNNNDNNNLNENITSKVISHPIPPNLSSSMTLSPYSRSINQCTTDNIPRLGHLNWSSNNSSSHPYNRGQTGYSTEFTNTTRRRNATKESTTTLKAWLQEHIKNPYPTKGEKIMLAIITKMTLTQVSTWFANARRRLKKENKMTWTPKHRGEEHIDEDDDEEEDDVDDDADDDQNVNEGRCDDERRVGDDNKNCDDDDDEDEMTESEEDLNIMELSSNQDRNHSTLKDSTNHSYFRSYSSDKNGKHNKSAMKPDSLRIQYHKNESYNDSTLTNTKKPGEIHHCPLIPPYPTSNTGLINQMQPNLNATFEGLLNEQYNKINSTLNQLNTFNKSQDITSQNVFENNTPQMTTHHLNHSIENHLDEFRDKIGKKRLAVNLDNSEVSSSEYKLANMSGCNLLPNNPQSSWTDMITTPSVMKYDTIPFGPYCHQNRQLPHYFQDNLQVSPYIHGFNTPSRTYPTNPVPMSGVMNSSSSNLKCTHRLSGDNIPLSLSALTPIATTITTTTTTTTPDVAVTPPPPPPTLPTTTITAPNPFYTHLCHFQNTMHLLSPTPFNPKSYNSETIGVMNMNTNHDRISLTNILNPKEFLQLK